jgi:predicted enzyme related to lactoylglutathione lyase
MAHAVNWFEIPCIDLDRGKRFYETVLGAPLMDMLAPGMKMAAFPADWQKGEISGALVVAEGYEPRADGAVIYLNGGPDLQVALDKVGPAGGKVVLPKTAIPMDGGGYFALFVDSEGNRVGLTSMG